MSVPITYRQKMDFSSCVKMVGFPKYSHISVRYANKLEPNMLHGMI